MIPLRYSSVPLERLYRLADDEESYVELINLIRNPACTKAEKEIKQCKVDIILFPDRNAQVKELKTE